MVLELHNSMRGCVLSSTVHMWWYRCSESLTRMSVEVLGDVQQCQTIDGKGLRTCSSHLVARCMQKDPWRLHKKSSTQVNVEGGL